MSGLATRAQRRQAARPRRRITSFVAIVAAFVLLLAAAGTVMFAQLAANGRAPWVSTGLSAAAFLVTILALALRRRP